MKLFVTLLALAAAASSAFSQTALDYPSVWRCDASKFNWYCDEDPTPPKPADKPAAARPANPRGPVPVATKDIKTAEQMRVELKRREDVAVMNPSDQNLREYLELWQMAQDKGAVFADSWRRVVWTNPDLDYSLRRPVSNASVKQFDAQLEGRQDDQLRALAKEHGLIFFFRSDCPYCHQMAPVLKMLQAKYGIEVLGVTVDGGGLPDFPTPQDGRSKAAAWGVERVPALFIGSKANGDHAAIGFGGMALSEIVQRIFVLTGTKPGDNF